MRLRGTQPAAAHDQLPFRYRTLARPSTPAAVRRPSDSALLRGGLAGSGVKILGENLNPPRRPTWVPPPGKLGDKLPTAARGRPLTRRGEHIFDPAVHWTFRPGVAGVYGAAIEASPFAGAGMGWALPSSSGC